jgi:L-amino acid N-acyltransferase YncA
MRVLAERDALFLRSVSMNTTLTPCIRLAREADLPAINAIYNHFVTRSTCTYQITPETGEARLAWFRRHDPHHPVTVSELDGEIVGWASLNSYHAREAYARTVENSIYVRHDRQRRGIGSGLLADSIIRARFLRHHTILALISAEQAGSIALHEAHGFVKVGHMREVGRKFDRWLDVVTYQLLLGA